MGPAPTRPPTSPQGKDQKNRSPLHVHGGDRFGPLFCQILLFFRVRLPVKEQDLLLPLIHNEFQSLREYGIHFDIPCRRIGLSPGEAVPCLRRKKIFPLPGFRRRQSCQPQECRRNIDGLHKTALLSFGNASSLQNEGYLQFAIVQAQAVSQQVMIPEMLTMIRHYNDQRIRRSRPHTLHQSAHFLVNTAY